MSPPPRPPYEVAHLDDVPHTPTDASYGFQLVGEWKQLRHYFAMREFSANAFVATEAGQEIVHEHFEQPNDDSSDVGDEELYFLHAGAATIELDGESVELRPGSVVFVGDPAVVRKVTATEPGTVMLTFGTNPGVEFVVSKFELEMSPPPRWAP
jgi:mannose-6-phosphate isomerase-like protein (cupin superfamily)